MVNSRAKGARGERFARDKVREFWGAKRCVRTAQVSGKLSSDLSYALPGWHVENKFLRRIGICRAMDQAIADAAQRRELPVVLFRENNGPLYVMFDIENTEAFVGALVQNWSEEDGAVSTGG